MYFSVSIIIIINPSKSFLSRHTKFCFFTSFIYVWKWWKFHHFMLCYVYEIPWNLQNQKKCALISISHPTYISTLEMYVQKLKNSLYRSLSNAYALLRFFTQKRKEHWQQRHEKRKTKKLPRKSIKSLFCMNIHIQQKKKHSCLIVVHCLH